MRLIKIGCTREAEMLELQCKLEVASKRISSLQDTLDTISYKATQLKKIVKFESN